MSRSNKELKKIMMKNVRKIGRLSGCLLGLFNCGVAYLTLSLNILTPIVKYVILAILTVVFALLAVGMSDMITQSFNSNMSKEGSELYYHCKMHTKIILHTLGWFFVLTLAFLVVLKYLKTF